MTSSASSEPEPAADGGAGNGRHWPKPSRRQTWGTVGLLAILIGVGVFAVVNNSGGRSGGTPGTTSPGRAGGTSGTAGSSGPTTLPESSSQAAAAAASLEIKLRSQIGGCWDAAEAGAPDGAYRQDFHHPKGTPCGGPGWDVAVQFFATRQAAARAARGVAAAQGEYTDGADLIVLARDASAATRRTVASEPGLQPA